MSSERVIVVGDVHGCVDELADLLSAVGYARGAGDRLVLLGDLMDRGPDPVACVRLARQAGAEVVLGNHEDSHVRWRDRERARLSHGRPNNMRYFTERRRSENSSLTDEEIEWMRALPPSLDLGSGWTAVHAGFEPAVPMDRQAVDRMIRIRFVDSASGEYIRMGDSYARPAGSAFWSEMYGGPGSVVYGHAVHTLAEPRQDEPSPGVLCVGIDTGCVYGGHLTAFVMEPGSRPRFVQVKARKEYYVASWLKKHGS